VVWSKDILQIGEAILLVILKIRALIKTCNTSYLFIHALVSVADLRPFNFAKGSIVNIFAAFMAQSNLNLQDTAMARLTK
jgi:hypothetical protein